MVYLRFTGGRDMRSWASLWAVVWVLAVVGCGDEVTKTIACETGDLRPCVCDAGAEGVRACSDGVFGGCECSAADPVARDAAAPDGPMLRGRVFDAETGGPLVGASVETDSGERAVTGGDGAFALKASPKARSLVVSRGDLARSVKVSPAEAAYIELFVKRIDARLVFDADEGVTAQTASGAQLEIPPGAVRNKKGEPVRGPVTLEMAEVDGKDRSQGAALPGDASARSKEGKAGQRAVAGAIEVTLLDAKGNALDVDAKANVVAELPAREPDAPLARTTFSYDEKAGEWREEGKAERTVDDRGKPVYRLRLTHLSWWSYGDFFEKLTCLKTCVQDQSGEAVANAQVWMVGASFPAVQFAFSRVDGCLDETGPVGGEVVLVAQGGGLVSKSKRFQLPAEETESCADAGTLVLERKRSASCASDYIDCDGTCVDPATSRAHCGGCAQACDASGERAQACVAGACTCAANQESCGGDTLCANVARDRAACGACGTVCDDTQECVEGGCVEASCGQGRLRCGADCVDVSANSRHCGACATVCKDGQQCLGGQCVELTVPAADAGVGPSGCAPGFAECDGNLATICETKLNTVQHCGSCDTVCSSNHATAACQGSACAISSCDQGYDDCDKSPSNGCETDLASAVNDCGSCGKVCAVANGIPTCVKGACENIRCDASHEDCDGLLSNGCETDLFALSDCGDCDAACSVANGTASCATGICEVAACGTGFDDCDLAAANGCETDLRTLSNCGACAAPCVLSHGTASCATGSCNLVGCAPGYDDCDQMDATGCESLVSNDPDNCGGCDNVCTVEHGTPACDNGGCAIASCDAGWDDCDLDASNGCETDLTTTDNCGVCGNDCTAASGVAACDQGACVVASCDAGFDDCDNQYSNGCEVNLRTVANCGACGTVCSVGNGTPICQTGTCEVQSCSAGYDDCDGLVATGCEIQLSTNANHCGECGRNCAAAGASCSSGMCSITTLYSGRPYGNDNNGARSWSFNGAAAFHIGYNNYTVERLPVDGSGVVSIYAPTNKTGGTESVWATSTDVFWAERGTPSVVLRKPHSALPGDLPTVAWTPAYQPMFLHTQAGNWYWASGDYQSGDLGGYIYTRAVSALPSDPGTRIVTVDQGNHGAILSLTSTSDALYWVTSGVYNSGYVYAYYLHTTPLTGGTPTVITVPTLGAAAYVNRSVVLRAVGNSLYFNVTSGSSSFLNGIYRYTPGDTAPTQLVSADNVSSLLVDGPYIYFMQLNVSGVFRAPIGGGGAIKIAPTNGTEFLGVDATYLYMNVSSCCATSLARVVK